MQRPHARQRLDDGPCLFERRAGAVRGDIGFDEAAGVDAAFGADVADRADDVHHEVGLLLRVCVGLAIAARKLGDDERFFEAVDVVTQVLPDRLGDEGHNRMEEAQARLQRVGEHRQR